MTRKPPLEHGWWDGELAAFDTETTGVDPYDARLVTATLIVHQADHRETSRLRLLVNPGVPIPEGASKVHGITDAKAAEGIAPDQAAALLVSAMRRLDERGIPLVIFKANYDWTLLHAECWRHGVEVPPSLPIVDPTVLDRWVDKYRKGKRTLKDCCEVYKVKLGAAHTAAGDARAALYLARRLGQAYPGIRCPVDELNTMQAKLFEEWRTGINAHWAGLGETKRVEAGWPIQQRPTRGAHPTESGGRE